MSVVLVLGSGPNVIVSKDWPRDPFDRIVAINNAWAVRPDWDDLVHPDDFPPEKMPPHIKPSQRIIRAADYVPLQNEFGGFVYAGGTMAFTAGYWALAALKPKVIAVLGCDMVYDSAQSTHFYGTGTADPLRKDVTLRSLEAKSARLMAIANRHGCSVVNLSRNESRLVFPRAELQVLHDLPVPAIDQAAVDAALAREASLNYFVSSGKYWKEEARFDPEQIDALDALWLKAIPDPQTSP